MYDGETITNKNNEITNISFSKSDFPLNNIETNTTTYRKTQELSSINLFRCLKILNSDKKNNFNMIENCKIENKKNIFKEIYKRFIIPFYIPLLVLINYIVIYKSKENAQYNYLKMTTFFLGVFFIIFSETTIRLISNEILFNLYISVLPILIFTLLYLKTLRTLDFKK